MSETSRSLHDRIEKARQAGTAYATATTPQQAAQATATINALLSAPPITFTTPAVAQATRHLDAKVPGVCATRHDTPAGKGADDAPTTASRAAGPIVQNPGMSQYQ